MHVDGCYQYVRPFRGPVRRLGSRARSAKSDDSGPRIHCTLCGWSPHKKEESMVKVSVLYPNREGTKFDMAYYLHHHIPLVRQLLGSALKGVLV